MCGGNGNLVDTATGGFGNVAIPELTEPVTAEDAAAVAGVENTLTAFVGDEAAIGVASSTSEALTLASVLRAEKILSADSPEATRMLPNICLPGGLDEPPCVDEGSCIAGDGDGSRNCCCWFVWDE
jgi:hypothetical protein